MSLLKRSLVCVSLLVSYPFVFASCGTIFSFERDSYKYTNDKKSHIVYSFASTLAIGFVLEAVFDTRVDTFTLGTYGLVPGFARELKTGVCGSKGHGFSNADMLYNAFGSYSSAYVYNNTSDRISESRLKFKKGNIRRTVVPMVSFETYNYRGIQAVNPQSRPSTKVTIGFSLNF